MSFFREVNTGQIVEITEPPFYLDGLARWERTEEDPRDPEELAALVAWLDAENEHNAAFDAWLAAEAEHKATGEAQKAQSDLTAAREHATTELADLDAALAEPLTDEGTSTEAVADAVAEHDEVVGNEPAPADPALAPADAPTEPAELPLPDEDADREDWIAYATQHGRGPDFKGIKTRQIVAWFR